LNKGEDDLFQMGQLGSFIPPLSLQTKTKPVPEMQLKQLETSFNNNNNNNNNNGEEEEEVGEEKGCMDNFHRT
jgi:hypothetical protein